MPLENDKLSNVTGGNTETIINRDPSCPFCGASSGSMKVVSSSRYHTVYQCQSCFRVTRVEKPIEKPLPDTCPVCGANRGAYRVISDIGNTVTMNCVVCGHEEDIIR